MGPKIFLVFKVLFRKTYPLKFKFFGCQSKKPPAQILYSKIVWCFLTHPQKFHIFFPFVLIEKLSLAKVFLKKGFPPFKKYFWGQFYWKKRLFLKLKFGKNLTPGTNIFSPAFSLQYVQNIFLVFFELYWVKHPPFMGPIMQS